MPTRPPRGHPFEFEIDLPVERFGGKGSGDRIAEQLRPGQRGPVHAHGETGRKLIAWDPAADHIVGPATERLEDHGLIPPVGHHHRRHAVPVGVGPQLVEHLQLGTVVLIHCEHNEARRDRFERHQRLRRAGGGYGNPAFGFDGAGQPGPPTVIRGADEHRALIRVERKTISLGGQRGGKLPYRKPIDRNDLWLRSAQTQISPAVPRAQNNVCSMVRSSKLSPPSPSTANRWSRKPRTESSPIPMTS